MASYAWCQRKRWCFTVGVYLCVNKSPNHFSLERLCPKINESVNAKLISGNPPFAPGKVLQYECKEGYELIDGQQELSCRKDGKWSGKAPNCTGSVHVSCHIVITYRLHNCKQVHAYNGTEVHGHLTCTLTSPLRSTCLASRILNVVRWISMTVAQGCSIQNYVP